MMALLSATGSLSVMAAERGDTLRRHVGYTVYAQPAWQIAMDEYERSWLRGKQSFVAGAELHYSALPQDSDAFAEDYNYPTLSVGLSYSLNHGVTMRRTENPAWGMAEMVDYDSRLGNALTLYGAFSRPLLRRGRWQLDYALKAGVGYNSHYYNKTDAIDNELIGSAFTIYFGAGLTVDYQLSDNWALTGGLLYGHHSNGALARPNKGENHFGPFLGLRYAPYDKAVRHRQHWKPQPFDKYWYAMLRLGLGGKTLNEDFQLTQFYTDPSDPDYRTGDFRLYAAYSLQADVMCRYARRWASGIGLDVFYGTYDKRVAELDEAAGFYERHSPWSVGIAARHEVYYHNLSLDMALGVYLYRHMGANAREVEQPYYERIGIFYTFPRLGGLRIGGSVKAHRTKADLTELIVALPFRLTK